MASDPQFKVNDKGQLAEMFGQRVVCSVTTENGHTYYLRDARVRPAGKPAYVPDALALRDDSFCPSLQAHVPVVDRSMSRENSIVTGAVVAVRTDTGERFGVQRAVRVGPAPWDIAVVCVKGKFR